RSTAHGDPAASPPFPTRRSSDLARVLDRRQPEIPPHGRIPGFGDVARRQCPVDQVAFELEPQNDVERIGCLVGVYADQTALDPRSEEHTSELQSRENLVCRLLLE